MKIKKGDTILVITGKDKGKKGKIIQALPSSSRLIVENINLRKKSVKPKTSGQKGQVVEFPAPINISNVKIMCPKCSKSSRVGYIETANKKVRICKNCDEKL